MGANRDDPAPIHDRYPIDVLHCGKAVGDDQRRAPLYEAGARRFVR